MLLADNSASFKFKQEIAGVTGDNGTKNVEVMVPLKCLSNFWRTLEMPSINCEINLILSHFDTKATTFAITDTKLDVPVVTLSVQDNAKLLEPLKIRF